MSPRHNSNGAGRRYDAACESCWIRRNCLLGTLSTTAGGSDGTAAYSGLLPRRAVLYGQEAPADALFVVRSGSVKTSLLTAGGTEHVLDFHLPGDVLGLEDVYTGRYAATATTLERASVCTLRTAAIEQLLQGEPGRLHALLGSFGRRMQQQRQARLLVREVGAGRRLERFLLDWSDRLERLGFSGTDITLNMTRFDIGSYLALAPETVSRKLTRLHELGVLALHGRQLVLDKDALASHHGRADEAA